jgi:hypothetical protein
MGTYNKNKKAVGKTGHRDRRSQGDAMPAHEMI